MLERFSQSGFASLFHVLRSPFPTIEQVYKCPERDKFAERRHVDAVAVGRAYRRRGRCDDDPLRPQPVEHRQDCVLHRVAAHDGIVQHDKRVPARAHQPVGDVVDMLVELAACRGVGNEGAELRVLHGDLAKAWDVFATKIAKTTKIFIIFFVNSVFFVAK